MTDPEDKDEFEQLVEAFTHTQGSSHAVYHILLELVVRIAGAQPDPSRFLNNMFEAISAKLDQLPLETEKKRAAGETRETLSTFFSVAESAVRGHSRRKGRSSPRPE